jgi:hypothetical protein
MTHANDTAATDEVIEPRLGRFYRKLRNLDDTQVPRDLRNLWNDVPVDARLVVKRVYYSGNRLVDCQIIGPHKCSRNYEHVHSLPRQAFTTARMAPVIET